MTDDAQAIRDINAALQQWPMPDRLVALACSIIGDAPCAAEGLLDLVGVTGMLARQLPPAARLRICWALLEEVQAVGARWN
jgi:hypothetical protein